MLTLEAIVARRGCQHPVGKASLFPDKRCAVSSMMAGILFRNVSMTNGWVVVESVTVGGGGGGGGG